MNKKGLTLIELLAVIVILALILLIGVPKINDLLRKSKLNALRDSALLILKEAEREYIVQKTTNKNFNASSINCSSLSNISIDYETCEFTFDSKGKATINLTGSDDGKFSKMMCNGTRDNINCREKVQLPGYTDAVEYLTQKYNNGTNSEGLIQTNGTELRYQGADPNNYVYFNCTDNLNPTSSTCEVWRIIGVFDGRVKLVRKYSLGNFSWDTSASAVNDGHGINQWGPSGTYEGADLMRELNGDYLNSSLSTNTNWYNGVNNKKDGNFNKNYVLKTSAQELIGNATWYTGGIPQIYNSIVTLAEAYAAERGTQGKICAEDEEIDDIHCNDEVERTYTWIGKVGLIYVSDFGYASGNINCATDITNTYCDSNWMGYSYNVTITPADLLAASYVVWITNSKKAECTHGASNTNGVRPSVYLIPGIQIKGSGTTSDPYSFA